VQTLRFVIQLALGIALPLALQLWDRRRLTPLQRAVCWNGATWAAALYAFGPLSMVGWCWVTRGAAHGARRFAPATRRGARIAALGLGVGCAALIGAAIFAVDAGLAAAFGLPP
jgi:hypothetical protein